MSWRSHIPKFRAPGRAGAPHLAAVAAVVVAAGSFLVTGCDVEAGQELTCPGSGSTSQSAAAGTSTDAFVAPAGQGGAAAAAPGSHLGTGPLGAGIQRAGQKPAAGAASGSSAAASGAPASATITLVTGMRVRLDTTSSGQTVSPVLSGHASPGTVSPDFVKFTWGGDLYAVPDVAVPYLGSLLDPRLFDVSYLARAGLDDADSSALPVTIAHSGSSVPVPGADVTAQAADVATAKLSKADAGQLGQLLDSRWRASARPGSASARSGSAASGSGALAGVERISLAQPAGGPPLPALLPQAPLPGGTGAGATGTATTGTTGPAYHTLTINFNGLDGYAPAVFGWVQNVKDAALGSYFVMNNQNDIPSQVPVSGLNGPVFGPLKVSVPDGTYSVAFSLLIPDGTAADPTWYGADGYLVTDPQVTVNSDQTITLDPSKAAANPYQPTVATSPPATAEIDTLGLIRVSADGGCYPMAGPDLALESVNGGGSSPSVLGAAPTAPVTIGGLGFDANSEIYTGAFDPSVTADVTSPQYFLDFPHSGSIPSSLKYSVSAADLTTVRNNDYEDTNGCTPALSVFADHPQWGWAATDGNAVYPVGELTDYWYTSDPSLDFWETEYGCHAGTGADDGLGVGVNLWDEPGTIRPGEVINEDWNKGPLVPNSRAAYALPGAATQNVAAGSSNAINDPQLVVAPATRQGSNGMLYLTPFGDSDPTHVSFNGNQPLGATPTTGGFDFYRNGTLALSHLQEPTEQPLSTNQDTLWGAYLPMLPQAATYRIDWTQPLPDDPSTTNETDWTFTSGPADPSAHMPAHEECGLDPGRPCSFLPLLFIRYDLALNDMSQATAGAPFTIAFTVNHQQGEPAPTGVTATVSASFDGGATWSAPQAARKKNGQFTTTISQPALAATNGFVSLRVQASDGAGNSVTQTITRAYALAS